MEGDVISAGPIPARSNRLDDEEPHGDVIGREDGGHHVNVNVAAQLNTFHGVFPGVETMECWERLVPGGAERLLAMVETQVQHRQYLERTALDHNVAQSRRGTYTAGFLGACLLAVTVVAILFHEIGLAFGVVATSIVALSGNHFYSRRLQSKDMLAKTQLMVSEMTRASTPDQTPGQRRRKSRRAR